MNKNYDLQLTAHIICGHFETDITFDPYNDCTDIDQLKDFAISSIEDTYEFIESGESIENIQVEITYFGNVPEEYANSKNIWEFAEAFAENDVDVEVIEAGLYCGVSPSDIEEAYQGEYKSDEDFAQEMADQLGAIDKNASWPMNCIDWKFAARELMYDYSSHMGHYFRNL